MVDKKILTLSKIKITILINLKFYRILDQIFFYRILDKKSECFRSILFYVFDLKNFTAFTKIKISVYTQLSYYTLVKISRKKKNGNPKQVIIT